MIHVTDGYYIKSTEYSYIVCTKGNVDKNGRQDWNNLYHYTTFLGALGGVRKAVQRERLTGEKVIELDEALNIMEGIEAEFEELTEELKERVGDA